MISAALIGLGFVLGVAFCAGLFVWAAFVLRGTADERLESDNDTSPWPGVR